MDERQTVDFWLLVSALLLAGIGLVMVYSSSMYISMEQTGTGSFYFRKQAFHLLLGLAGMMVLTKLNYRGYEKLGPVLLGFGYILLLVVLVQKWTGHTNDDASRWIRFAGMNFQPSELMKLFLIIFMSASIANMGDRVRNFKRGYLPLVSVLALTFMLIIVEPNLSVATLTVLIGSYILFIGRANLLHLLMSGGVTVGAAVFAISVFPYMRRRVELFLAPGGNHQLNQSIIGIGSGGLFGVGLGNSTQKFLFLPDRHTDFVFSIISEELGYLGVTIILAILLLYIVRGLKIAREAPDMFGFLVASGISVMVGFQSLINLGVVTGLLPTTGMTLPFISYGGSSLIQSFLCTGILLNISKQANYERRLSREFGSRLHRRSIST